jgi:hypothetical protein
MRQSIDSLPEDRGESLVFDVFPVRPMICRHYRGVSRAGRPLRFRGLVGDHPTLASSWKRRLRCEHRSRLAAEFVTDHRSTFPSFDPTIIFDANNFFILDFLLFLEYIEAKFYALNVPRFT